MSLQTILEGDHLKQGVHLRVNQVTAPNINVDTVESIVGNDSVVSDVTHDSGRAYSLTDAPPIINTELTNKKFVDDSITAISHWNRDVPNTSLYPSNSGDSVSGGTGVGGNLVLESTTDLTKGTITLDSITVTVDDIGGVDHLTFLNEQDANKLELTSTSRIGMAGNDMVFTLDDDTKSFDYKFGAQTLLNIEKSGTQDVKLINQGAGGVIIEGGILIDAQSITGVDQLSFSDTNKSDKIIFETTGGHECGTNMNALRFQQDSGQNGYEFAFGNSEEVEIKEGTGIHVDNVNELTTGGGGVGVTIDGVLCKDFKVTATGILDNSLTASKIVETDGSKNLVSVTDLSSHFSGTANQVTISGTDPLTFATPQDTHTGATPQFTGLDIITGATTNSAVHIGEVAGGAGGEGGYFSSTVDNQLSISAGAQLVGGNWTGRSTVAEIIDLSLNNISFFNDTSLVDGSTYVPTMVMCIDTTSMHVDNIVELTTDAGIILDGGWKFEDTNTRITDGSLSIENSSAVVGQKLMNIGASTVFGARDGWKYSVRNETTGALYKDAFEMADDGTIAMPETYNIGAVGGRDLFIQSSGQITYDTSIRSAKINIKNITDHEKIYDLTCRDYNARLKDKNNQYTDLPSDRKFKGFIAEEVEAVCQYYSIYDDFLNKTGLVGIDKTALLASAIKCIQDQKIEIESLKTRVTNLEANHI